jgi:hypothetical protein
LRETFLDASIMGARSGAKRLGCEQPAGVVETPVPHPSRPAGHIQQGARLTKNDKRRANR